VIALTLVYNNDALYYDKYSYFCLLYRKCVNYLTITRKPNLWFIKSSPFDK